MPKKTRVSFDFTPSAYEKLKALCEETGSTTKAEVVKNAIRLYATWIERKKAGYDIQYVKGDEKQLVELIF